MAPSFLDNVKMHVLYFEAAESVDLRLFKQRAKDLDDGRGLLETIKFVRDLNGFTALHTAAAAGRMRICKYLIEDLGLDVDFNTEEGETALLHATFRGQISTAEYLLSKGANPAASGKVGLTPLHMAAEQGHCELLKLLISKGAPIDPLTFSGTPLHMAARRGQEYAVKILLKHHANPNMVFEHFITPLAMAVQSGSLKCTKLLLKAGADVNGNNSAGLNLLCMAANEGFTEIIKCLLEAGANPNMLDEDGFRPIEVAALENERQVAEILFPFTTPIPAIPEWSINGIFAHVQSTGFQQATGFQQKTHQVKHNFSDMKSRADVAFRSKEYLSAIHFYRMAMRGDASDAPLHANMSLCWLRLGDGERALRDAQQCRLLRPYWPKGCYRVGSAWMLLKDYCKAANAFADGFTLDPCNGEIEEAMWKAVDCMNLHETEA